MRNFSAFLLLTGLLICMSTAATINNQYIADEIVHFSNKNGQGIYASVSYVGSDTFYQKVNSTIVTKLNVTILFDSDNEFTITIDDAKNPRFRLPYEEPYPYTKAGLLNTPLYQVNIEKQPFSINVQRLSTKEIIFDTAQFDFIYSNFYLSFGTHLPSRYLYGMGERRRDFLYDSGLYTIWNKDQYAAIDSGKGNQQTYGCHPMYLMRENSANWHVTYLRNSNGMDFTFNADTKNLQYFITGSIIELKFFLGNKQPEEVLKLYHNYINGWSLMPFWSYGYHQSKYGMLYFQDMKNVVANFTYYKIPIDVIWSDIDYMYSFTDFTVDNLRYNETEVKELAEKIHWVPIIDAGVSLNTTAPSYNMGMQDDVFIKSANNNTNPLVGVVWPGVVHFPDWLHPNTSSYWRKLLTNFHTEAPFSGVWLDMNENSNFCSGEFNHSCVFLADYLPDGAYPSGNIIIPDKDQDPTLPPSNMSWFNSSALPYLPGNTTLEDKSLSINAIHYGNLLEFDMHNTNGLLESKMTYEIMKDLNGERPFILSRSTHAGSGQYAAHWSGDNYASWDFLRLSVSCIFNFQLYGIPMSGDDICGFAGNTTVELCARWMQLGAFYPFMRNHMAIGTIDHYPYSLGDTVLNASLASLNFRYSILKYYYSLTIQNRGVGTIFKPLFFEFPEDESILGLDTQFLIGTQLMAAAVTQEGETQVNIYFPSGSKWYDFFSGQNVFDLNNTASNISFSAPLNGTLPAFIRGGSIIPVQNTDTVQSTKDLDNVLNLVIALTPRDMNTDSAAGAILGISNYSNDASVDRCIGQNNCLINLDATATVERDGSVTLSITATGTTSETYLEDVLIGNVTFYGVRNHSCHLDNYACLAENQVVKCDNKPTQVILGQTIGFKWTEGSCQLTKELRKMSA